MTIDGLMWWRIGVVVHWCSDVLVYWCSVFVIRMRLTGEASCTIDICAASCSTWTMTLSWTPPEKATRSDLPTTLSIQTVTLRYIDLYLCHSLPSPSLSPSHLALQSRSPISLSLTVPLHHHLAYFYYIHIFLVDSFTPQPRTSWCQQPMTAQSRYGTCLLRKQL